MYMYNIQHFIIALFLFLQCSSVLKNILKFVFFLYSVRCLRIWIRHRKCTEKLFILYRLLSLLEYVFQAIIVFHVKLKMMLSAILTIHTYNTSPPLQTSNPIFSLSLSITLSLFPSVSLSLSHYLPFSLSLSIPLSLFPSVSLAITLSPFPSVSLSITLSLFTSVFLYLFILHYLPFHLKISILTSFLPKCLRDYIHSQYATRTKGVLIYSYVNKRMYII